VTDTETYEKCELLSLRNFNAQSLTEVEKNNPVPF